MKEETWYEIALVLTPVFLIIGLLSSLMIMNYYNIENGMLVPIIGFGLMGGFGMIPLFRHWFYLILFGLILNIGNMIVFIN